MCVDVWQTKNTCKGILNQSAVYYITFGSLDNASMNKLSIADIYENAINSACVLAMLNRNTLVNFEFIKINIVGCHFQ